MDQATGPSAAGETRTWSSALPGLGVAAGVATGATLLQGLASRAGFTVLSSVFLAIVIGVALRASVGERAAWAPGLRLAAKRVLKLGIILLGLRFGVAQVWETGGAAVLAITTVVLVAFAVVALLSRVIAIDRRLSLLIGVGTAICGNSAIAATAPLLDADEEEISFASATITLFGMIAMVAYPALAYVVGLSDLQFGLFAGAGVHDSAQAIASGFLYSTAAGGAATIVKLTRTAYLIPVVLVLGWLQRRHEVAKVTSTGLANAVPWFALGFVALAAVRSLGDATLNGVGAWTAAVGAAGEIATFLIVVAMAAVGLQTDLRRLRAIGPKPFYVGFASAVTVGAAAFTFAAAL